MTGIKVCKLGTEHHLGNGLCLWERCLESKVETETFSWSEVTSQVACICLIKNNSIKNPILERRRIYQHRITVRRTWDYNGKEDTWDGEECFYSRVFLWAFLIPSAFHVLKNLLCFFPFLFSPPFPIFSLNLGVFLINFKSLYIKKIKALLWSML